MVAGGAQFLAPLQAASALSAILSNLDPSASPAKVVLAALRALWNITETSAVAPATSTRPLCYTKIADALFVRPHLSSLSKILSQCHTSSVVQCQISLAASLVARLTQDERHQQTLADCGVLDALATRLSSFVVASNLVMPGAEEKAQREQLSGYIPPPAPTSGDLACILEAIAVVIQGSRYRASQLLYSPSILAVFPITPTPPILGDYYAAWRAFTYGSPSYRHEQLSLFDYLLPYMPNHQSKASNAHHTAFPPLGSSNSSDHLSSSSCPARQGHAAYGSTRTTSDGKQLMPGVEENNDAEPESPVVSFLFFLLRSKARLERLYAAFVLTILYRNGLTAKHRDSAMALLVVPLLASMLEEGAISSSKGDSIVIASDWAITERVPEVLSILIRDNEMLQKAAYDSGVADKLCQLLKVAYNPVVETAPALWSPEADVPDNNNQALSLGACGQPALLAHRIRLRESTLKGISSLVVFKDEYRKGVVDQGIIPFVIESMCQEPKKPLPKSSEKAEKGETEQPTTTSEGYGYNPISVLIAACDAIRALSRSVSVLRTTLIDNGVAEPVFTLMRHSDTRVQIAASAAVCNLVTDVSPLREVSWVCFQDTCILTGKGR